MVLDTEQRVKVSLRVLSSAPLPAPVYRCLELVLEFL